MEGSLRKKIEEEAKKQARLAGPTIVANLLSFVLQPISIVFVGHLKEKAELSGAAVALTFANVTGFSVLVESPICLLFFECLKI
ncbi:MATE efflux family protein 7 [Apostasia shenzhenica]|uniref:MATE efflux family protein 7 n=1 Tax=Apostasia shenzhenica TaxID=1088818 RepID=A0A2H9ZRV6_9ASPA|nr:MATE efflux family protein 7 [Apostasia shenzhenica]